MNTVLRTAREAKGITQSQLAMMCEISETHYQNIEYGKNEPGIQTAIRIAEALGIETLEAFYDLWKPTTPK